MRLGSSWRHNAALVFCFLGCYDFQYNFFVLESSLLGWMWTGIYSAHVKMFYSYHSILAFSYNVEV